MITVSLSRCLSITCASAAALLGSAGVAVAAAPDGASGPWADAVTAVQQGGTSGGGKVVGTRSHPDDAVGVAEDGFEPDTFISLGIGGRIALRFDNPLCNGPGADLQLREATNEPYPDELADVYASPDGTNLILVAKAVNKDAAVDFPTSLGAARYVVLVDATNPEEVRNADGYDLDGIEALHTDGCSTPPPAAGGATGAGTTTTGTSTGSGEATTGGGTNAGTPGTARGGAAGIALLNRAVGLKQATCVVPKKMTGRTVIAARKALAKARCASVKKVKRRYSKVKAGRVVGTSPRAGSRRPYRTKVTITVSRGPRRG